jgi:pentose-5-phosphate-3-epimerase
MTKVEVNSGACGFSVLISAEKGKDKKVHISLETDCEMVKEMLSDISTIDMMTLFSGWPNNPVYKSAAQHLKHVSCPVPSGILKAVEVEAGLAVPKEVKVVFLDRKDTKK